jgi:hypothetical protein
MPTTPRTSRRSSTRVPDGLDSVDPSLPALVAEIVIDLPESRALSAEGTTVWSRADHPFAALGPDTIEIRLDRDIAAAAARTPDAAPSSRGPDWISFSPGELDPHAVDRLRAWLELAYRRAAT